MPLGEVVDLARLSRLGRVAGDLGRIERATSLPETLHLMRYVDGADDAAEMARAAEALGPQTRVAYRFLGKGRVLRALVRLTDLALTAAALVYALALQLAVIVAERLGRAVLRATAMTLRGG